MKDQVLELQEKLTATFGGMLESIVAALPKIVLGIVLLVVALLVAKLIERITAALLTRIRFDDLLSRLGLDATIQRIGVRQSPARLVARILYLLLLFLFARTAADALGLTAVSQALGSFLAYVPNLVAAGLIILLGSAAGQFAGRAVSRSASESGIEYSASLGSLVYALVLFITGIMALGQLRIDTDIVRIVTVGLLLALALAFGLSLGLGTREITRNILAGFYARKVFRVGEEIEIGDEHGVLKAITPTQTLLDRDDRIIAVSNSVFLEKVIRQ